MGIIRTDCDYMEQSTPGEVGTRQLFRAEKLPENASGRFRSPRRNELRYAQYNQRLNCCTLRYCSLIEKNPEIFFEEEKQ